MGFQRDLRLGQIGQQKVVDIFTKADIPIKENTDKKRLSKYDLIFPFAEKDWTIEVKYDLYAAKSGNIAIEYFNPKTGKPSGIMATLSDFWIQVLTNPDKVFMIKTEKLRKFLSSRPAHRIIGSGGDGNASLLLYTMDSILGEFVEIDSNNIQQIMKELTSE